MPAQDFDALDEEYESSAEEIHALSNQIYVLGPGKDITLEFFSVFSRFECALKSGECYKPNYFLCWDEIPTDKIRLKKFLIKCTNFPKNGEITVVPTIKDSIIKVSFGEINISLIKDGERVILKTDDKKEPTELITKMDNGKLNLYCPKSYRVNPDWDKYAKEMDANIKNEIIKSKCGAYLLNHPPKVQVIKNGSLDWDKGEPCTSGTDPEKMLIFIFKQIKQVRNNLFHGGKFHGQDHFYTDEKKRNNYLIEASLKVLYICLKDVNSDVTSAFKNGVATVT